MTKSKAFKEAKALLNTDDLLPTLNRIYADLIDATVLRKDLEEAKYLLEEGNRIAHKLDYKTYLKSDYWQWFRSIVLHAYPKCDMCNNKSSVLHHSNYDGVLFRERLGEDIRQLCFDCHEDLHKGAIKGRIYSPCNPPCSVEDDEHDELHYLTKLN